MKLSPAELTQYDEEGYLFFPAKFSPEEVAALQHGAEEVLSMERQEVWREANGAPRTAFAAHLYSSVFGRLSAHPRLLEPVVQIVGGDVYMHQFKVNAKAAFDGDVWQWHQDFGVWHRDDEMPEPRAMNIAVFIDEVSAVNGPLMFIPRSHKHGVQEAGHDLESTSYPLWTLNRETVKRLAEEGGIVAPTGPPGSVIMFHGNLVHASPPNISPWNRVIVYLSLCHVDNHIRAFKRPEWIAHRDFSPIVALSDDCLVNSANAAAAE